MFSGAFRERLHGAWVEIRENLGRSTLQTLGVVLGVASVLGGFSISDSQRKRSDERWVKLGGMDRLNVQPSQAVKDGQPTALQTANLGLRNEDAEEGDALDAKATTGVAQQKNARARVRSAYADQDRQITGIGGDYLALNGYTVDKGRGFTAEDYEKGQAVAILGAEAASTFFPTGEIVGQTIRVGDIPVVVVGTFAEKVFRWRDNQGNQFAWRNRIVAVPSTLVATRMNGDRWQRVDRVVFRMKDLNVGEKLTRGPHGPPPRQPPPAGGLPHRRHRGAHPEAPEPGRRLQHDLHALGDPVAHRRRDGQREHPDGDPQGAGARGRRQDGDRRLGPRDLQGLHDGGAPPDGLRRRSSASLGGIGFSKTITSFLQIPLYMQPASFLWAFALAAGFGFLFALYPAWKASRLSPMEALRYE